MTPNPKEKATELIDKFYFAKDKDGFHSMSMDRAKQCALICVDEMIKDRYLMLDRQFDEDYAKQMIGYNIKDLEEVKKEIENA